MRRSVLTGIAAVAFVASSAFAQATSFAGTWNQVVDPAQQQAAGGGGRGGMGGFGPTFSVAQDAKTITITRTTQAGEQKSVYNLDGTDSKNMMPGRGGNPGMEQVSNAKWEGANLVIVTKVVRGEQTFEQKRVFSVDKDGSLWIETSSNAPGRDGQPTPATKVQYKKG